VSATTTARSSIPSDRRITRDDIEAKLTQIQGGGTAAVEARQTSLLAVGVVAVVIALLLAYLLGRRRGKRRRTVVEVRRI
jgi:hypothetical protein